ncbi:MAG: tRNA uridine-5-carboxymethylaminomethyl(34) synthesis enzyme MnmG [Deltaproteobacteria bacterium]|nr:tRNA uridine-5-carboxymethylaminomethyl(34) synthesis enzyme MnmG [Deltaproteobacteria bacterium]
MLYDVIVVGGGHAGLESALAAARLGQKTLLVTQKLETVGALSCNPAFGGPAKGGLLREVDALGGYAGLGADRAAVQCRILGEKKGPAARATRNLVDRTTYNKLARQYAAHVPGLFLLAGEAKNVLTERDRVIGLELSDGQIFKTGALVLTGGTFWNGRIYHGLNSRPGGRIGEEPATYLKKSLLSLGHRVGRLSTSTAPRLLAETVNTRDLEEQPGDPQARPFSVLSPEVQNKVCCHLTWTNPQTHRIVADNLKSSIIYADNPVSSGPRYCPSLEDKIHNFPHRARHMVFLEPDGPDLIYPGGLPTGLAPEVQQALINSIVGLEKTVIARPGYAIEYDFSDPTQLAPSLESLLIRGLFMAGQINGTSGYEEAASQGIWAGTGAALRASGSDPMFLGRNQALLGVMLDDLTVLGVAEPYRMFTSRAEWRLMLREDNADLRLSPLAEKLGLLDTERIRLLKEKQAAISLGEQILSTTRLSQTQVLSLTACCQIDSKDRLVEGSLLAADFLKRPSVKLEYLTRSIEDLSRLPQSAWLTLETEIKFEGYLARQAQEIKRLSGQENMKLAADLNFSLIPGLSREAVEILEQTRPLTLGQASRLRGVTPASLSALAIYMHKQQVA